MAMGPKKSLDWGIKNSGGVQYIFFVMVQSFILGVQQILLGVE